MYLTARSVVVRNFSVALVNGSITLIILLIAPLGLAAVIANTFLVTAASFLTATVADSVIRYLQPYRSENLAESVDDSPRSPSIQTRREERLDRRE